MPALAAPERPDPAVVGMGWTRRFAEPRVVVAIDSARRLGQTSPMKRLLPILAAAGLLALTACGFQLRSALVLPPGLEDVRVSAQDPYSALAGSLENALARAGATVVPTGERRRVANLGIHSEHWADRPLSIDQFGRAQEYTLAYAVVFSLIDASGDVLVPQQVVEMTRDYTAPPTEAIGTQAERELLVREMQREMTASILRRIDAASRDVRPKAK